jgi:heme/copper-type cytochrome/quinol oxidase subunit 2
MKPPVQVRLSLLWSMVVVCTILAGVFTLTVEMAAGGGFAHTPDEVKGRVAMAALANLVPILMIYFSRVLEWRTNRTLNLCAGVFTLLCVVGGLSPAPHGVILGAAEAVMLIAVLVTVWRWKPDETNEKN